MKFMQIKPQKARGKLLDSMWEDPDWVAEEKFDGDRRISQFVESTTWCTGDTVRFTGTRQSVGDGKYVEKTANLPHLAFDQQNGMTGTVLDGEIIAPYAKNLPGGKSKYVTSIMGSNPAEAIRKQKASGWLEYMVFDCLWWKGKDLRGKSLTERRVHAARAVRQWSNLYAKMVPQEEPKRAFFERVLKRGGEGVILKHREHTYGNEKLWVKVKGEWTADCVVTGFTKGKGKYVGQVGALTLSQYKKGKLVQVSRPDKGVSGFDDATRLQISMKPHNYLNLVVEIAHNGREPTGAFRHPRFKRFRPDKSPRDCVYREDET